MKESVKKGHIFIISGPSGVGKGTLLSLLLKKHPEIYLSISVTTRTPRRGEINGVHYFFVEKEEFQAMIEKGELLEWAEFAGNYYGTVSKMIEEKLSQGKDVILEIEVKGALQSKKKMQDAILIFIMPPSMDELKRRLIKRKTESEESIKKRLDIVNSELEKKDIFNYQVVNKKLNEAVKNLEAIIMAERSKIKH